MHGYEHFYHDPKFWVAVSFVLFFLLLGKKLWGAIAGALDGREVVAEHLDRQVLADARDELVEPHLDRLRKSDLVAR